MHSGLWPLASLEPGTVTAVTCSAHALVFLHLQHLLATVACCSVSVHSRRTATLASHGPGTAVEPQDDTFCAALSIGKTLLALQQCHQSLRLLHYCHSQCAPAVLKSAQPLEAQVSQTAGSACTHIHTIHCSHGMLQAPPQERTQHIMHSAF